MNAWRVIYLAYQWPASARGHATSNQFFSVPKIKRIIYYTRSLRDLGCGREVIEPPN